MTEIVFPKNNEEKYLDVANKLKIKELIFVYPFKKNIKEFKNKIKELKTPIKIKMGILTKGKDIVKAKHICDFVISDGADQRVFENFRPNCIINLENSDKKDKMHYRYSGLNQVFAKLAKQNNIQIGFSFSNLLNHPKTRATLMGRIRQNIRICKKYKVKTNFSSFAKKPLELRTLKTLRSLQRVLR